MFEGSTALILLAAGTAMVGSALWLLWLAAEDLDAAEFALVKAVFTSSLGSSIPQETCRVAVTCGDPAFLIPDNDL